MTETTPSGATAATMPTLTHAGGELVLATFVPDDPHAPIASLRSDYAAFLDEIASDGAVVLHERAFGDLDVADAVSSARGALPRRGSLAAPPLNCIDGGPTGEGSFAGIHLLAARPSGPVRVIEHEGQILGRLVTTEHAEVLALSDVARAVPARGELDAGAETEAVLAVAETILSAQGWSFHDVIRTWFYLRDILSWYDEFNRVRNVAFRRMGLLGAGRPVPIPASTGIEGTNALGGHCTLDVLAVRGRDGAPLRRGQLENRRQNEATEYGSAFARGTFVDLGALRYVFVSGTASIDDHGRSVHDGDFAAQTRHTFEAIEALLDGTGAGLRDFRQATGFVKRREDVPIWERMAEEAGFAAVPTLGVLADVCRPELLFELDGTAVVAIDGAPRS